MTHPARVLMTIDAVGGVWSYGFELARGLRRRGIDVVLAAMGPAPTSEQRRAVDALGLRLEHAPLDLQWIDDPWRDVASGAEWLLELEARLGCDLVHLNGYAHGSCPFRSPKVVVAHCCVLSWWESVFGQPAPARWANYREHVRDALEAATHVVAPTRWMRDTIERHYGPVSASWSVIHNAVRPAPGRPSEKQPFILSAGRVWDGAKNLATLGRASDAISWKVKIAGPLASSANDGQRRRRESGARRSDWPAEVFAGVDLLGPVSPPEMKELYASAAIYALPARYEPFGLTILEAALSGCALVLGDIPSLREIWEGAAVFVPPDDDQALVTCLRDLIRHPEMTREMGTEALARAAEYRHDEMVDAYVRAYAEAEARLGTAAAGQETGCAS
jgi:glycosyltransferase involved in cell wall biosynthesis